MTIVVSSMTLELFYPFVDEVRQEEASWPSMSVGSSSIAVSPMSTGAAKANARVTATKSSGNC